MNKSIVILLMLLCITPAYAAIDDVPSCNFKDKIIAYNESGLLINNELYDKGAVVFNYFNLPLTDLKPSYQTTSLVDKNIIDAGDELNISIQIVGQGDVKSNLLSVTFPPNFLDPEYRGYSDIYIMDIGNNQAIWFNEKPCEHGFDPKGFTTVLPEAIFGESAPNSIDIWGEKAINGHSPIVLMVKTDASATPGDRLIKINFLYSDGKEWYSTREEIPIHIRDWYEKKLNQILIGIIGVAISSILGIIGLVYDIRRKIKDILKRIGIIKPKGIIKLT